MPRPHSPRSQPPHLPPGLKYDEVLLPRPPSARRPHSPPYPPRRPPPHLSPIHERPEDGHQPHRGSTIPRSLSSSQQRRNSQDQRSASRPLSSSSRTSYHPLILNLRTTSNATHTHTHTHTHKCSDARLFRPERKRTGTATTVGSRTRTSTIAVPILPGPTRLFNFDVSVMTLTPTEYTPSAPFSELNWPLLAAQGFTKHDLHRDHVHDSTWTTMTLCRREGCGGRRRPPTRLSSVIRHQNVPGVDLLWCGYDATISPRTFVHMTALEMVDMRAWTEGVKNGAVGQVADMDGRLGWIEPGEDSPLDRILQSRN
ncbi:hypothetical protein LTR47_004580 [Exophiala xenobiotica]|nr:hypothetical protein LTR41_000388 [Exophiala xenobiotica]KAK5227046.1 hypothetical protein LTR72_003036 [Exophiala xenobiotica]KAK5234546.1 hypothetical protein LTR47_004580 [Exophiala xenobiotica]KAK5254133.1 hypothetical protein LTS06_001620 [Exophiala xenobiotica]KAK5300796.1 hypothetical protein LTR14_001194 [Exophiala xenobiotica]